MKFRITVKYADDPDTKNWVESYSENTDNPKQWAENAIKYWNTTLRPHERKRELLAVTIDDPRDYNHEFVKLTGGMSVKFRGGIADLYQCSRCDVTGKRLGIGGSMKIDSKFRGKVFLTCTDETRKRVSEIG